MGEDGYKIVFDFKPHHVPNSHSKKGEGEAVLVFNINNRLQKQNNRCQVTNFCGMFLPHMLIAKQS